MPQVITGYEPDTDDGWEFVDEEVVQKGAPGTPVVAGYQDSSVISIAGFDLWSSISNQQLVSQVRARSAICYYLSRWRNPPSILGTGLDQYRICYVGSP